MEGLRALARDPAFFSQSYAINWLDLLGAGGIADLVRSRVHVMVLTDAYNKKTNAIISTLKTKSHILIRYLPTEK